MNSTLFNTAKKQANPNESHLNISASASDISRLRNHVNDLTIPYVEIRFNTRLREVEKRWPMFTLKLAEICQGEGYAGAENKSEHQSEHSQGEKYMSEELKSEGSK
ncbi:hypothetical protein CWE08_09450 [Aliidiomarina iranensis]|uniref:Uncharacterized protein n=1 Tax=Aliidiomarina iranensis TaxID=1434071 RepID=A0A432VTG2_9GAMM|nr:hypothetical protein [Aliidiomarina iranensis]RUO19646.1 hypothetical protein CWE08_09450 [Aliidiomarina iranensis]